MANGMIAHHETYEYLGEVAVRVQDMQPVWEKKSSAAAVTFPADQIWNRNEVDINMPREQAWDYLIQPEFRNTLIGADELNVANRTSGRTAPGSVFHCFHGDRILPQTVLEWQPFNSMIVEERFHRSIAESWLAEYTLESFEGGTRLTRRNSKPTGSILERTILF